MKSVSELERLIVFFIQHFPRPLGRTELVKLIYLFEFEHVQLCGAQYSAARFQRDYYGPFDQAILHYADRLSIQGVIDQKCTEYGLDRIRYEYKIAAGAEALAAFKLPAEQETLAKAVIARTRNLKLWQVKDLSYQTAPMLGILADEKRTGKKVLGRVINMKEHPPLKRFTAKQLQAARERLDVQADRGSDAEYARDLLKDFQSFDGLRRRANACLLK